MTGGNFSRRVDTQQDEAPPAGAPLGGTKAEATQRLQIGLAGLGSMVLLIALANALGSQADLAEESAVPEAAPTTEPSDAPPQRDPLADAGIVPEIPAEPVAGEAQVEDLPAPAATSTAAPPAANAQQRP